jgi:hypothetical protein
LLVAIAPFLGSLALNPRSGEDLPRFSIADLAPDSARVLTPGGNRGFGTAIIVTRDLAGTIHAFHLFMSDGRVGVPGVSWTVNYWCDDFGALQVTGQPEATVLTCKDAWLSQSEYFHQSANSRWTLAGRSLATGTADLDPVRFLIEQDKIVVGKGP